MRTVRLMRAKRRRKICNTTVILIVCTSIITIIIITITYLRDRLWSVWCLFEGLYMEGWSGEGYSVSVGILFWGDCTKRRGLGLIDYFEGDKEHSN